jgi:hypothetical protein
MKLTVLCVLRSGGIYDASWVEKLKRGCERHLRPHTFNCLSDVPVPCNRIPLKHDWPGWWSKVELFREGVIDSETLYLDLDTVCVGPMQIHRNGIDFAMLQSFWKPDMVGSGVMYFSGDNVPHKVYEKFAKQPKAYIAHHERNAEGTYVGDQAFLLDTLGPEDQIARINDYMPGIKSYKMHCQRRLPADASIVCFHGRPRPTEVDNDWMKEHWV